MSLSRSGQFEKQVTNGDEYEEQPTDMDAERFGILWGGFLCRGGCSGGFAPLAGSPPG
jgi:hypothetical protein